MFPDAKIGRLDLDTTRSKNAYQDILQRFDRREFDILIGTQMVTKGLDFDNVSLVGILDADMLLRYPDFRAFERSFQLMTQVAGRAGRKSKRGKVIIQTGDPDNWIIQQVIRNDYDTMYKQEIIERRNFHYPPFFKLITIKLKHKSEMQLEGSAAELGMTLKNVFGDRILGPEYPLIKRIQNYYIKVITVKVERDASQKKVKNRISEIIDNYYASPSNKSVKISIDVDPN
jgi:primosomal protein N' (replication factor Y)